MKGEETVEEWLRALVSIAVVLGLALALRYGAARARLSRIGRLWRSRQRQLEALDRLSLSPQHTLHLVRVGDRALLIGAHPAGCSLLESLPAGAFCTAERCGQAGEVP